jgi:uncharacterized lipoprotein YajG
MFKQALCLSLSLTLAACATNQSSPVVVSPKNVPEKELMTVKKVELVDLRKNKALAIVNGKNMSANTDFVTKLNTWLNNSIDTNPYGSKNITFNLLSYASYVKQESISFQLESVMEWQVKIDSKNTSWTKSYQTTMQEEGPLMADNSIIEKHLNKLAEKLLNRSLNDGEFEQAVFK